MADQQASAVLEAHVRHSLIPKELPILPRHVRLKAWIRRYGRQFVHDWWAWGVIAAIVSMAAMVALVALLAEVDHHKQQTWAVGNTQLTLNTIVVAIGTIIRSSLLLVVAGALNQSAWNWFASRNGSVEAEARPLEDLETFSEAAANSWNSLKLLWRTKGRYIASIGALIMVLSIAFDTFVQQVMIVEIQPRDIKLSGANLTAQNILPCTLSYSAINDYNAAESAINYLRLESVVTSGILKTSSTLPGANCPTGNCTWPVTPTIGVCSECMNLNATVTATSHSTCNFTTYTLPPLSGLTSGPNVTNSTLTVETCGDFNGPDWKLQIDYWPFEMSDLGRGRNTTIANFYSWGVPSRDFVGRSKALYLAYKCSFYFCVKGYFANSSLGKTNQEPVQTTASQSYLVVDNNTYWWVFDDVPPELNAGPTAVFRVDEEARKNLGEWITEWLSNNIVHNFDGTSTSSPVGGVFLQARGSLGDLTALVQGVSDSLTVYTRTANSVPAPDARFAPMVGVSIPVVVVRWAWLAYPLALQLGGLVFLGMTMYATHRRRVRPWKGHRVPLLLAHLDENVRAQARGGLAHRTGLDDRVGTLRVRLEFDGDDGIVYRRVHSLPQL